MQTSGSQTIHIRKAVPADAPAIADLNALAQSLHAALVPALFKPAGPETFPVAAVLERLAKPENTILVALAGSLTAGYAYVETRHRQETPISFAYDEVYLQQLCVAPGYRRRGIGSALIEAVRDLAGSLGIARIALDVWTPNEASRAFFRARGFAPCTERWANGPWRPTS